jgi:hypothetical protein
VVTRIEYAIEHKDIALEAFLDIEEAFDKTSFDTIKQVAERHGIEPAIWKWFFATLESRSISATLSGENLKTAAARGCPQGGVLSPLLWSVVVDGLLWGLNSNGCYTVGYADDMAILINGKSLTLCQRSYSPVHSQKWCERTNLSINPNKKVIAPFLGRGIKKGLKNQSYSTKQSSYPLKSCALE